MVQTVFYHLDSTPKIRGCSKRVHLQNHASSNMCIEPDKLKSKKNHCIKLQPLSTKTENNVPSSSEGKFSCKLNSPVFWASEKSDQRRSSKIPVLQRKVLYGPKLKNDNGQYDKALSAADRRQKFHQSHVRIAATADTETLPLMRKQKIDRCHDLLPWYNDNILQQANDPPVPAVNKKSILPPIKAIDVTPVTRQKPYQPKNKGLLGEITHFPALCNPSCLKRQRSCYASSVTHLPLILPPAAPPPSISTSLEREGNQMNEQIRNTIRSGVWSFKFAVPCKTTC